MSKWEERPEGLCRSFKFKDFKTAFGFMTRVAFIAEEHKHHPDWHNVYNQVDIKLNTHDQGGAITDQDRLLASAIDELHAEMS